MVRQLKEAGAIVLAKSNMAEWAFSPMVTISSIAGETLNPYNLAHVPAGSSGGTAAAVAASLARLASEQIRAILSAVHHHTTHWFGFRVTLGLTSRSGIAPLFLRADVGGPMARTVRMPLLCWEAIASYDPEDH